MTDSLLRRAHHVLTPVQRRDVAAALAVCAQDPVAHVVPAQQLETARDTGVIRPGLWALRRRHGLSSEICAVLWCGANLTVAVPREEHSHDDTERTVAELASSVVSRLARPASLVGERDVTLDLWDRVEQWWGPAREVRSDQVSMVVEGTPRFADPPADVDSLEPVRLATLNDYEALLPACVHMFTAEVGYDPMLHGRAAYEERIRMLIKLGRAYLQYGQVAGQRQVVFKSEVGAKGGGVAQLHGVWTHPDLRGRGLARASLAHVITQVQATTAPVVSLYVNDFNHAAVRMYDAVGFRQVGTFATVML